MPKYRKKPVEVSAIQWSGKNLAAVLGFIDDTKTGTDVVDINGSAKTLGIQTLEGTMRADAGDWIIRGVKGELYPCKPDIFEATYEPAAQQ